MQLNARCLGSDFATRQKKVLTDIYGEYVGEAAIVPTIYIADQIRCLRNTPTLNMQERFVRLKRAAVIFKTAVLFDLTWDAYVTLVSRIIGFSESLVSASASNISHHLQMMEAIIFSAKAASGIADWQDKLSQEGCGLWTRVGDVLAVVAAGNGPGVHALWPQAIALGYKVVVKPSMTEPLTACRLVHALEQAGLGNYVAFMPTDHTGVGSLVNTADRALVYGGAHIEEKYANNSRVLVQGPGRSKIVIGKDVSHEEALPLVAQSVASLGGAACVCTSAVLVEDDPAGFAQKLSAHFSTYKLDSFPRGSINTAKAFKSALREDTSVWVYGVDNKNAAYFSPHVSLVPGYTDSKLQRELPFPCVTVGPFDSEVSTGVLSNSLVVTLLSRDRDLIENVLAQKTIANVYIGSIPTTWMHPLVPHDSYLSDFLMRYRGLRVDQEWLNSHSLDK